MEMTLGKKIVQYRKEKGMTQEEMAEKLGVSSQAVSKWENDISCPDILLLAPLAKLLGVTVDELLSDKPKKEVELVPQEQRKKFEDMILTLQVRSSDGDKVKINLPMALVKMGLEMGMEMPQMSGSEALKNVDLEQIVKLAEKGLMGKLVEIESSDGDIVEIMVV